MVAKIAEMNEAIQVLTKKQAPRKEPEFSILIAGGHDGANYLNTTEMFNFATKTWQLLGEMKESRLAPSAFIYQNNIIVAGGFNGDTSTDRMEGW